MLSKPISPEIHIHSNWQHKRLGQYYKRKNDGEGYLREEKKISIARYNDIMEGYRLLKVLISNKARWMQNNM